MQKKRLTAIYWNEYLKTVWIQSTFAHEILNIIKTKLLRSRLAPLKLVVN